MCARPNLTAACLAAALVSGCREAPRGSAATATASAPIAVATATASASATAAPERSARPENAAPSPDPVPMVIVPAGATQRCRTSGWEMFCDGPKLTVATFALDATEVTVGAYQRCVEAGACRAGRVDQEHSCNWSPARYGRKLDDPARHPVNCVTFAQAEAYCRWAGKRLPTGPEWQHAARAPDGRAYPWGNDDRNSPKADWGFGCWRKAGTCRVGLHPPTPLGLHDIAGNVSEWTTDAACAIPGQCDEIIRERRTLDHRLLCGSNWTDPIVDEPGLLGLASCTATLATESRSTIGFRCARSVAEP